MSSGKTPNPTGGGCSACPDRSAMKHDPNSDPAPDGLGPSRRRHIEAMQLYYDHTGWGEYATDFPSIDGQTYAERGWEE